MRMSPELLAIIRLAIGSDEIQESEIPSDATFTVRRDVEYLADEDHQCAPEYAAPNGEGWEITGDEDPIESEWVGDEQLVRAYRWDQIGISIEAMEALIIANDWEYDIEPMMGYLDWDGMHPAVSITSDGMDWNQGGWTPVFIASDYLVLN
jgi:hypothetical protein